MASNSVQVKVQFFANPRFDQFKHFCAHGSLEDLNRQIDSMTTEVSKAQIIADSRHANIKLEEEKVTLLLEEERKVKEAQQKAAEEAKIAAEEATRAAVTIQKRVRGNKLRSDLAARAEEEAARAEEESRRAEEEAARKVEEDAEKERQLRISDLSGQEAESSKSGSHVDQDVREVSTLTADEGVPRSHYAGTFKDNKFVKSRITHIDHFSEDEKAAILADIEETRRLKVEELVRRQKKHAAQRRKEQQRIAKRLGNAIDVKGSDEERKQKVKELKKWLKEKDEAGEKPQQRDLDIMDRLIADRRRTALAKSMAALPIPQRVLHRHVHHHVHCRDGASTADNGNMGMRQVSSAADFRSQPMQGQRLVNSASAGQMHGSGMNPSGFDFTAQAGAAWPAQYLQGVVVPPGSSSSLPSLGTRPASCA